MSSRIRVAAREARPAAARVPSGTEPAARTVGEAESTGQALPESVRARLEAAFGADFSGVTVREEGGAAALGAVAWARGEGIAIAPGWYDPYSPDGLEVLGHELAHVLQQRAGRVPGAGVTEDPALEAEAHEAGHRVARGQPAGPAAAGAPPVPAAPGTTAQGHGDGAAPAQPMRLPGFLRRLRGGGQSSGATPTGATRDEGETPYQPIPQFEENPYDLLPADFNQPENPYDLLPADFNDRAPAQPEYDPESDPVYNTLPAALLKELAEGPYHTIPPELLAQQNATRLARYGTRPPPPRPKLTTYPKAPPPRHVRFQKGLEERATGSGYSNLGAAAPARGILRKRRD